MFLLIYSSLNPEFLFIIEILYENLFIKVKIQFNSYKINFKFLN